MKVSPISICTEKLQMHRLFLKNAPLKKNNYIIDICLISF